LYAVHQHDIAVVLSDMMMPVMDGNATIRVLLKIRPDARIIAASGLNEPQVIAKAVSSGVKHFLTKPYTAEDLLHRIREALA
jgi:CheY-like chemotaxis protein